MQTVELRSLSALMHAYDHMAAYDGHIYDKFMLDENQQANLEEMHGRPLRPDEKFMQATMYNKYTFIPEVNESLSNDKMNRNNYLLFDDMERQRGRKDVVRDATTEVLAQLQDRLSSKAVPDARNYE